MGEFHDDLKAAIERIRKAAVDNGKRAGVYCVGGDSAKMYKEQGFHMVSTSLFRASLLTIMPQISVAADVVALPTYLSNELKKAQG